MGAREIILDRQPNQLEMSTRAELFGIQNVDFLSHIRFICQLKRLKRKGDPQKWEKMGCGVR